MFKLVCPAECLCTRMDAQDAHRPGAGSQPVESADLHGGATGGYLREDEKDIKIDSTAAADSARLSKDGSTPDESPSTPSDMTRVEAGTIWVDWEPGEAANPHNWPMRRRWLTTLIAVWFTFLASVGGGSFPIGLADYRGDLGVSRELGLLAISSYPLGFGIAPLMLAPVSEVYGTSVTNVHS